MRRTPLIAATALVAGCVLPLFGGSSALADPESDVRDAQAKVAQLGDQAEAITERWHASQIARTKAQAAQQSAQQALLRTQAEVEAQRSRVASATAATYKAGALGQVAILVGSSDPQSFLDRAAALGQMAHSRSADLSQLSALAKQQSDAQAVLANATKLASAAEKTADDDRAKIESTLAQQRQILSDAVAKQAAIVAAAQAAQAAADAAHAAEAAATLAAAQVQQQALQATQTAVDSATITDDSSSSSTTDNTGPSEPVRAGSGVDAVIAAAKAQVGKPYVYGAAGPNTFDCSGLVMWAYRAAGVSLPHYTGAQANSGRRISISDLQPGDLVFFYSDLHHVGLYVGNGMMINAPHTGDVVKYASITDGRHVTLAVRIFN